MGKGSEDTIYTFLFANDHVLNVKSMKYEDWRKRCQKNMKKWALKTDLGNTFYGSCGAETRKVALEEVNNLRIWG